MCQKDPDRFMQSRKKKRKKGFGVEVAETESRPFLLRPVPHDNLVSRATPLQMHKVKHRLSSHGNFPLKREWWDDGHFPAFASATWDHFRLLQNLLFRLQLDALPFD